VLDLASGQVRQLTPTLFQPGRVSWSPDGRTIVLAAVKPVSKRFREGTSQLLYVDVASTAFEYVEPMPFRSLATRGDDGPVELTWQRAQIHQRTTEHAGALWDGRSKELRRDVDVVLDGSRIAAVRPHRGHNAASRCSSSEIKPLLDIGGSSLSSDDLTIGPGQTPSQLRRIDRANCALLHYRYITVHIPGCLTGANTGRRPCWGHTPSEA
jgi:hypothetical protein